MMEGFYFSANGQNLFIRGNVPLCRIKLRMLQTKYKNMKTRAFAWFAEEILKSDYFFKYFFAQNAWMKENPDGWWWTAAAPPVLTAVWQFRECVIWCFQTVGFCHHLLIRQPSLLLRLWGRRRRRRAWNKTRCLMKCWRQPVQLLTKTHHQPDKNLN